MMMSNDPDMTIPSLDLVRCSMLRAGKRREHPDEAVPDPVRAALSGRLVCRPSARDRRLRPDRKSTRLNSSHTVISYAVFCLKKKKAQTITRGIFPGSKSNIVRLTSRNSEGNSRRVTRDTPEGRSQSAMPHNRGTSRWKTRDD